MNLHEFDFRYSWTKATLDALDHGMTSLRDAHDDGLDLLEHAEELVGLGFVAVQTYIAGSAIALRKVFPTCPFSDEDLRARNSPRTTVSTSVQILWAAANYYKHHDEWNDWQPIGHRKNTIIILEQLGVSQDTEFPCVETLRVVQGVEAPLSHLLEVVASWREACFFELHLLLG